MIQEKDTMLTIKSNFNNFRDRQGQLYIAEDLDKLCKALVTSDIVNFPVKKEMSAGYTEAIAWKIADRLVLVENGKYLVINDISLQVANALTDLGVKPENVYLAYGKWKKNAVPDPDPTLYLLMKQYIKANIVETFNILKLEDIFTVDIKFNGVIANPPYGKIGAQITEKIKDKVNYEQYINLLPANDYKRVPELYQYTFNMVPFAAGSNFADAYITTHLAEVSKTKVNTMSEIDFVLSQFIDTSLTKYFYETAKVRQYKAFDQAKRAQFSQVKDKTPTTIALIGIRDIKSEHLTYSKTGNGYRWNVLEDITVQDLINQVGKTGSKNKQSSHYWIEFDTASEKRNFVNFIYSSNGFRFISKVFKATNVDSMIALGYILPKVDWTQSWTVEEILADYGYTEAEIAKVMADLENFKDMERD